MLWVFFELHRQVDAIQMSTHNICLYKEKDKKYTACNLKTTELLDCALIGVCVVIRLNTVIAFTATMLWANIAENKLMMFIFLFFLENKI